MRRGVKILWFHSARVAANARMAAAASIAAAASFAFAVPPAVGKPPAADNPPATATPPAVAPAPPPRPPKVPAAPAAPVPPVSDTPPVPPAAPAPAVPHTAPVPHKPPAPSPALPALVDLRPVLVELGLPPRPQGARGTCSIFTTCSAIEFALARVRGRATRLSPEFLNWAASQAAGAPSDGNFFHHALAGFARFGICEEAALPYRRTFDASLAPTPQLLAEAARVRDESHATLTVHWIMTWQANRVGVKEADFALIKRALAGGYPVAAGAGHSRLLVGYRDDAGLPGGGAFLTLDSALARFDEVPYQFVRDQVGDVFWVEAVAPKPPVDHAPVQ